MKKLNQIVMLLSIVLASCGSFKNNYTDDPIRKFEKSNHRISLEKSDSLYNNFNNRLREPIMSFQKKDIKRTDDVYDPTKYVLINIDTLESYLKFLREVEKKNKGNGIDKKITGIAVFLGAESNTARIENKAAFNELHKNEKEKKEKDKDSDKVLSNEDIRGRITMFLAPTYRISENRIPNIESEIERHIPFYIQPYNDIDPYIGDYMNLITRFGKFRKQQMLRKRNIRPANLMRSNSSAAGETSLNSNEFTNKPPGIINNLN